MLRPTHCCFGCLRLRKGALCVAALNVSTSILFILLGGVGVGLLPQYPLFFAQMRKELRRQYQVGEIQADEYSNMNGYVSVLEGSLFNTSLSSLIIATIWFFFNLAMALGILLRKSRWMVPFLILVAGLAVACGLLVVIGSIWMMTSQALIGYGFMALLIGFPLLILPVVYTYYVVYAAFIQVREQEMLWDEADQFDDGLGTGVEGAELEHSYLPSQLVLEPLPKNPDPTIVQTVRVHQPDYQRF